MTMKLLTAMAADGAAIASPAPPRPPNVPAGPRRDRGTAESSPHRHRGTAGAPIDAAVAHGSPTFGHAARRRRPRIRARARAHVARRLARIPVHPIADGGGAVPPGRRSMPSSRTAQPSLVATFGRAARRRRPRIQARGARARRETSREGSRPFARHRGDQARSTPGTTSRRALRAVIMMNDDTGFSRLKPVIGQTSPSRVRIWGRRTLVRTGSGVASGQSRTNPEYVHLRRLACPFIRLGSESTLTRNQGKYHEPTLANEKAK